MVSQGDLWDLVSFRLWGDEGFMHLLLEANPDMRHIVIFKEPTMINVPDVPVIKRRLTVSLPPWKG
jgi:phage tail protein X